MRRVLIQAGHLAPREPGFEGGTGTAGEIDLTRGTRDRLVELLLADGRFDVTAIPGRFPPGGWTGEAAVYLHGDGGAVAATGFHFGFPTRAHGNATAAQETAGRRLVAAIAREYAKVPGHPRRRTPDNSTPGLRGYYGYSRTRAPARVLVELGFLTNPTERAWLQSHRPAIALALYRALLVHFRMVAPIP